MKILLPKWSILAILVVTGFTLSEGFAPSSNLSSLKASILNNAQNVKPRGVEYSNILTKRMLFLEAAKDIAISKAKEKSYEIIEEKKEEVIVRADRLERSNCSFARC